MGRNRVVQAAAATAVLFLYPALVSAEAYSLTVAGERLEFVPQPEKGYVIRLAEKAGAIHAMAGLSALDGEDTRPIRGLGRRGVWTVENDGPAGRNEGTIRVLRARGQAAYAAPLFASGGETVAIIPEIVVRVKPGIEIEEVQTLCEVAGCTIRKRMEFTEQEYLLEVLGPDAEAVFAAVEQLSQAPEVEWVCPNTACRPRLPHPAGMVEPVPAGQLRIAAAGEGPNSAGVFPNDEYFPNQWHLHNTGQSGGTPGADIRAPEALEITTGDPNIVVAVLDLGVDTKHPDLAGNLVAGYDFVEEDDTPDPWGFAPIEAHGTACAGIIAARGNNGTGVAGVAYGCRIMPVRVSSPNSFVSEDLNATAFRWAAVHGADVLSCGWLRSNRPLIHSAIQDVTMPGGIGREGKGCVVCFASGNDGAAIPANRTDAYPEVIAVTATDHDDVRYGYSTYGPELDLVAPSGCIANLAKCPDCASFGCIADVPFWTTDLPGERGENTRNDDPSITDYIQWALGASMSCPIVAGVAALILSVEPNLTSDEVRYYLERSAKDLGTPGRDDYYGWGRVDARAALDMVLAKWADLNNDWKVDEEDEAILLGAIEVNDLSADIAPAARRDGVVDEQDLELLTRYLGTVMPELGLTAHWKFDETQGLIASDSAGKNNAAVMGGAVWQPGGGRIGGALQLTGVANFISAKLARNPSQGPMSVLVWVKGGGPGQVILSQAGVANWLMASALDGALMTDLKESGRNGIALLSQTVITDGAWHRVGLVWDGSNRILYVDDVEVARDTQSALAGSAANLTIGAGNTYAPGTYWSGLIDDLRIYDRAITP